MELRNYLDQFPFIAITRGMRPEEAVSCGQVLFDAGFRIIENPMNSPDPLASIESLASSFGNRCLIGAGTVLEPEQVDGVKEAGGQIIISPNCNPAVIERTKELGLISLPGVATPSEAATAIKHGADGLKLFPAEIITPVVLKAMLAVMPRHTITIPVGGINAENFQPYLEAGATGFGLGSSLYKAGISVAELSQRAAAFKENWNRGKF